MAGYNKIKEITEHVKTIERIVNENTIVMKNQQDLMSSQISVLQKIHDTLEETSLQQQQQFQQLVAATNADSPPTVAFKKLKGLKK